MNNKNLKSKKNLFKASRKERKFYYACLKSCLGTATAMYPLYPLPAKMLSTLHK